MKHSSEDTTSINSCRIDTLDVNMAHFRITSILFIAIFNYSGTSGMCNLCAQLLAHLSRRLTGELIGYSWSGVRTSPSVVRPVTFSNIFSKTTWPVKALHFLHVIKDLSSPVWFEIKVYLGVELLGRGVLKHHNLLWLSLKWGLHTALEGYRLTRRRGHHILVLL